MSSHAQISRSPKSRNPRGHSETSCKVTLTPCNPSKLQSSKTLSDPAGQSCKPPSSSDCDELKKTTLQKTLMKLSVQPERETDDEYENEADDDFRNSSQQPLQPADQILEENHFDYDKDAFIGN